MNAAGSWVSGGRIWLTKGFSTGSAGLIRTIQMFSGGHWVAASFCLVATIGWIVQGVGLAFYYRQVSETG